MKNLSLLFTICLLTSSAASAMEEIALQTGSITWDNDYEFRGPCRNPKTGRIFPDVKFECYSKIPVRYALLNVGNFPQLNLKDAQSCNTYVQNVSNCFKDTTVTNILILSASVPERGFSNH